MKKIIIFFGIALASLLFPSQMNAQTPARENNEWSDIWLPHINDPKLPRVLLVGDSITRAYCPSVEKALEGKAYVAKFATSQFLGDPYLLGHLTLLLDQMKFDVIHFNNGMHGWNYTEEQFRAAFPAYLTAIQSHAQGAKLIWATITPVNNVNTTQINVQRTDRIKARNAIAFEIVSREGLPIDDIFALVADHPEYHLPDGIHFTPEAAQIQGQQVAGEISQVLSSPK